MAEPSLLGQLRLTVHRRSHCPFCHGRVDRERRKGLQGLTLLVGMRPYRCESATDHTMVFVSSGGASTPDSMSTSELPLILDQGAAHTCVVANRGVFGTSNDAKKESLRRVQEDFPTPFVKGASFSPLTNNPTRRKRGDVRRMCQFLVG